MVHHAMTAKDSERQHLLAVGTAGSPIYTLYTFRDSTSLTQGLKVGAEFKGTWQIFPFFLYTH